MRPLRVTLLALSSIGVMLYQGQPPRGTEPAGGSRSAINVRQHGATGDGSTDDTRSIAAAFAAACASGGGTIDIPTGTYLIDPATAPIPICSNLVVQGPGTLRVKPDAGNYHCIFAPNPPSAAVNDLKFTGITVDQNTLKNTSATIAVGEPGALQLVWQIEAGTNLHLEGMHLYLSGVDPIDVNGPTVSGVYIERNYIVFQKRRGQPAFDNSAVYIDGDNFHVNDNTFVSTPDDDAVTAIEVHSGSGSVAGNTISRYAFGLNLVDLHGASVIGNNVRDAAYGISLWSTTTMNSVAVSGNTVSIDQVARRVPTSYGIATSYNNGVNGDFSNLQISGNVVTFEKESASREMTGAVNYGVGLQALGNISNVVILGNQIVRAPVRGITVGVSNAGYTTARVSVRDNQIIDAGSNFSPGSSDYSAGIALQGNLSSIDVLRNRLDFLSDPFIGHFSYWSAEAGFTFRNVVVADNYSTAARGTPENGLTASVSQTYPPR